MSLDLRRIVGRGTLHALGHVGRVAAFTVDVLRYMTEWRIWAYNEARPGAKKEYALARDEVIDVYATLATEGLMAHNPVWNLTKYGWVYSSWVQPVRCLIQWSARAGERILGAGQCAVYRHARCAK
jgi:hypothetical protein